MTESVNEGKIDPSFKHLNSLMKWMPEDQFDVQT